jgi:hypothetical protein
MTYIINTRVMTQDEDSISSSSETVGLRATLLHQSTFNGTLT